jgi:hypothetical protein
VQPTLLDVRWLQAKSAQNVSSSSDEEGSPGSSCRQRHVAGYNALQSVGTGQHQGPSHQQHNQQGRSLQQGSLCSDHGRQLFASSQAHTQQHAHTQQQAHTQQHEPAAPTLVACIGQDGSAQGSFAAEGSQSYTQQDGRTAPVQQACVVQDGEAEKGSVATAGAAAEGIQLLSSCCSVVTAKCYQGAVVTLLLHLQVNAVCCCAAVLQRAGCS